MNVLMRACMAAVALSGGLSAAWSQVTVYNPATNQVVIPSVQVGAGTYTGVTLLNVGNYTFTLQAATPQTPPAPGVAVYDTGNGLLSIPAVKVGDSTYLDVALLNIGNYTFTLQSATPLPAATADAVNAFLAVSDSLWANAVPPTGIARVSYFDACWRNDGRTRAYLVSTIDSDPATFRGQEAYRIGQQSSHAQVLALRNLRNADGSLRQEIDVQYDVLYRDGTLALGVVATLISGSSSGTPDCIAPQTGAALRFLGNQQLVATNMRSRTVRDQRYAIGSGAVISPAVYYRRSVHWQITDPMGNADYVIVSGPGPVATVGNVALPFSLKFISPRLLRSAPELRGKPGNFLNWLDDDNWRYCNTSGSNPPVAAIADCVGLGASNFEYGLTTSTPNSTQDLNFLAQGWVAGAVYRFDVYRDDGWKTAGGHVGKTPIATYYDALSSLPYTFVEMAGSGTANDRFPRLNFGALSTAQVQGNSISATPAALSVTWNAPLAWADGRKFGLFEGWDFHNGSKVGNAAGVFNPGYRTIQYNFPGSTATANSAWGITPKPADQASKAYNELSLIYVDRVDRQLLSIVSFQ